MTDALQIARANGEIRQDVSLSTITRVLKQHGAHPKQVRKATPSAALRSLHPNHVWVLDVSVCVLFYLKGNKKGNKSLRVMSEKKFYKNKPENLEKIIKNRVLRYLVVDHYSGAFYVEYFNVPGENWHTLFEFLCHAMIRRDNDPMHGIPKILFTDKGSQLTDTLKRFFQEKLDMEIITHQAGNPRAKGAVETMHNWIERKMEGRLYMMNVANLTVLNHETWEWMRAYNANFDMESKHGKTRWDVWMLIKPGQLRLSPPLDAMQAALESKPLERVIRGDGPSIQYDNRIYFLDKLVSQGAPLRVGDKAAFFVNPLEYPAIYITTKDINGQRKAWQVVPMEILRDENGIPYRQDAAVIGAEYKAKPDTDAVKNRKAMDKQAYGVDTIAELDKAKQDKVAAFPGINPMADVKQAVKNLPSYLPKRGDQLEIQSQTVRRVPLPFAEALSLVVAQLGRAITPEERKRIKEEWKDITRDDIAEIVAGLRRAGFVDVKLKAVGG